MKTSTLFSLIFLFPLVGCSLLTKQPTNDQTASVGKTSTLTIDGERRSIIVKGDTFCSEPPPDAMVNMDSALLASLYKQNKDKDEETPDKTSADIKQTQEIKAKKLFQRSQGVQAIRDSMYRLCEARANGVLGEAAYANKISELNSILTFVVPVELCTRMIMGMKESKQIDSLFKACLEHSSKVSGQIKDDPLSQFKREFAESTDKQSKGLKGIKDENKALQNEIIKIQNHVKILEENLNKANEKAK